MNDWPKIPPERLAATTAHAVERVLDGSARVDPPKPAHVDLDSAGAQLHDAYRKLGEQISDLEEQRARIREQLEERLGDAPVARVDGRPVIRWAWSKPVRRFNGKRFKEEQPDLWQQYTYDAPPQRRFVLVDEKAAQ